MMLLLVFLGSFIAWKGFQLDAGTQAFAYLLVCLMGALLADYFAARRPVPPLLPVREPEKEAILFVGNVLLGFGFLIPRFVLDWNHLPGLIRILVLAMLLFVFPIAMSLWLVLKRYTPSDLGFRFRGGVPFLLCLGLFFLAWKWVCPQRLTLELVLDEAGGNWFMVVFSGFITSGLSEEFFRMVGQSRLKNRLGPAWAWFLTSLIWALMHAPKWYAETGEWMEPVWSSLRILPLGLLWGYLTHRFQSLWPSTLLHALNFWGLQNF
jgi:membrane protease YdiL (CAAX protease family)